MALIDLDASDRKTIGSLIFQYIGAGLNVEGRMPQWWMDVERQYRNELTLDDDTLGSTDDPGYPEFHVPFSQPRLDMLNAQVCTVIGKQHPYMTDTEEDEDIADARQNLGHNVWKDAGFEHKIRQLARITACTDLGYIRLCPSYSQRGVLDMDVLHPTQVSVFPALPQGIQAAACVGHRLYVRRKIVDAMMDGKTYYKVDHLPAGNLGEHDETEAKRRSEAEYSTTSPNRDQDLLELWPCIVRLDLKNLASGVSDGTDAVEGEEKLYRATIDYTSGGTLLCLEEYPYDFIWYFRTQYKGSATDYYSEGSVGRDLYAPQDTYNSLWSAFYGGTLQAAMPPVFGPELKDGEKYTKTGFGTQINSEGAVQPWSPTVHFSGQQFPEMLAALERIGDQVARISQNTQGAQAQGQTTATEQSIIAAGVAVGIEEYIANFSNDFPKMMAHTMQVIGDDFNAFEERYGKPQDVTPVRLPFSLAGDEAGDTI